MSAELIRPDWPAPARVVACVSQRAGGVSEGSYASLNLGEHVGDVPRAVAENRRRLARAAGIASEPVWLEQVHGIAVADLDAANLDNPDLCNPEIENPAIENPTADVTDSHGTEASRRSGPMTADAAFTRRPGVVCTVMTADCLPVLFATADAAVVGVAHAGWRGLAGGVLSALVESMAAKSEIMAWLGPAIGPQSFEVGEEVREAMIASIAGAEVAFERNERSRWQADLYVLARLALAECGIENVYGGGFCTYAQESRFFSHRREAPCGRMASMIWLNDD